jgi:hypothetical protein
MRLSAYNSRIEGVKMKLKLIVFLIRSLLPVEAKDRKKVISAVFPGKHIHGDPKKVKENGANIIQS